MWCTLSINIFGSLLLGITASCVGKAEPAYLLLGVGLCGGFTTFSTISMEFTALLWDKRYGLAVLYGVGSMCGGVAAFTLGHWFFEWVFAAKPS
jgi:CrcB protein